MTRVPVLLRSPLGRHGRCYRGPAQRDAGATSDVCQTLRRCHAPYVSVTKRSDARQAGGQRPGRRRPREAAHEGTGQHSAVSSGRKDLETEAFCSNSAALGALEKASGEKAQPVRTACTSSLISASSVDATREGGGSPGPAAGSWGLPAQRLSSLCFPPFPARCEGVQVPACGRLARAFHLKSPSAPTLA